MVLAVLPVLFALLLGGSFWASQALIYEPFIVPTLSTSSATPIAWWLAVLAPEVIVCVIATIALRQIGQAILFCVLGGFAITASQFLAGLTNQPGHYKAIEGGLVHFGIQLSVITLLIAVVVGLTALVRLGVQRARAG